MKRIWPRAFIACMTSVALVLAGFGPVCYAKSSSISVISSQEDMIQVPTASTREDRNPCQTSQAEAAVVTAGFQDTESQFTSLDDPKLIQYLKDSIYADLECTFASDDFIINDVNVAYAPQDVFISTEYKEELEYNSKSNVYFGYSLKELDGLFQGTRYVFTPNDDGTTTVKTFEAYDNTYDKMFQDVAIGTGVVLVCVVVSVVTGGLGAAPVAMVFAASAKTGAIMALSGGIISAAAAGTITGFRSGDMDLAVKTAAAAGCDGFKWGAISGALIGGISETGSLFESVASKSSAVTKIPSYHDSEVYALEKYGGAKQRTFLGGKEVSYGTPGSTRPDVVYEIDGHLEGVEVKNYDLSSQNSVNELIRELNREVADRIKNMPANSTQRIALDTRGRNFTKETISSVKSQIWTKLSSIYPNIPIDVF